MALIGDRLHVSRCLQLACPPFTLVEERVQVLSRSTWTAAVQAGSGSIFAKGAEARGREAEGVCEREASGNGGRGASYVRGHNDVHVCTAVCVCVCIIYISYVYICMWVCEFGGDFKYRSSVENGS